MFDLLLICGRAELKVAGEAIWIFRPDNSITKSHVEDDSVKFGGQDAGNTGAGCSPPLGINPILTLF